MVKNLMEHTTVSEQNARDVWVFIEQEEGRIADVSLELIAKGQELARQLNSQVCGLLCGHGVTELAERVIHCGADRVLVLGVLRSSFMIQSICDGGPHSLLP